MKKNYNQKVKVSCKGGTLVNGSLQFSGSRTTSYATLVEKLNSINDGDIIASLVCDRKTDGNFKYELHLINTEQLKYDKLDWKEDSKKFIGKGNFTARISKNMSDQIWVKIPQTFIEKSFSYNVSLYLNLDNILT